jgi:uncharacterized protein
MRNSTVVGRLDDDEVRDVPLLEGRGRVDDAPTAYVCRAYACRLPVTSPEDVRRELESLSLA